MCCLIETEVAGQTNHFTQSQYTDTGSAILSTDHKHQAPSRVATKEYQTEFTAEASPWKAGFDPRVSCFRGGRLNYKTTEAVGSCDTGWYWTLISDVLQSLIKRGRGHADKGYRLELELLSSAVSAMTVSVA